MFDSQCKYSVEECARVLYKTRFNWAIYKEENEKTRKHSTISEILKASRSSLSVENSSNFHRSKS